MNDDRVHEITTAMHRMANYTLSKMQTIVDHNDLIQEGWVSALRNEELHGELPTWQLVHRAKTDMRQLAVKMAGPMNSVKIMREYIPLVSECEEEGVDCPIEEPLSTEEQYDLVGWIDRQQDQVRKFALLYLQGYSVKAILRVLGIDMTAKQWLKSTRLSFLQ